MRHRIAGRKLGLPSDQRRALLKGLVRALFINDKIITTETRAKEIKPLAEKLITTAKRDDIYARRLVRRYVDSNVAEFGYTQEKNAKGKMVQKPAQNPEYVVPRLFNVIAKRYAGRPGGYTRITKLYARRGDGAPMVLLELLDTELDAPTQPTPAAEAPKRRGLFARRK